MGNLTTVEIWRMYPPVSSPSVTVRMKLASLSICEFNQKSIRFIIYLVLVGVFGVKPKILCLHGGGQTALG